MVKISPSTMKELLKKLNGQEPHHKYRAIRTRCLYGHDHDSRKESTWCLKLNELEKEGKISLLVHEPEIVLKVNGVIICRHYPDFMYFDQKLQRRVILDVKGIILREFKNKMKMVQAMHPDIEYRTV